jgi:glucosamine-6-phosphate deaminase
MKVIHINIKKKNIHIPDGNKKDIVQECLEYERLITKAGGIDLQILGVGVNGHIGFNEPGPKLKAKTHVTSLSDVTIKQNSRFFSNICEVPRKAITMGLATIIRSKKIILMAYGLDKRKAILGTISGNITTKNPATLLQLHNNVVLIVDNKLVNHHPLCGWWFTNSDILSR